jgi:hypothetical protein
MNHQKYIETLSEEIESTIAEIETFRDMGKRHEISICEQRLVRKITILKYLQEQKKNG